MPETKGDTELVARRLTEKTKSWSHKTELIEFTLTLAVGAARYDPEGEQIVDEVIKQADQRMYEDKKGEGV